MDKVLILGTKNYDYDLLEEFSKLGLSSFFFLNKKSIEYKDYKELKKNALILFYIFSLLS